jgi:hypothetical protein
MIRARPAKRRRNRETDLGLLRSTWSKFRWRDGCRDLCLASGVGYVKAFAAVVSRKGSEICTLMHRSHLQGTVNAEG